MYRARCSLGFTIVELLVVITIVVVLLALLTPSLDQAVEQAQRTVCASNLHQTGVGLISFASDRKMRFPEGQPLLGSNAQRAQPNGHGIYFVWDSVASTPGYDVDPEFGRYRGHGRSAIAGYTHPKLFYCAANWHPNLQYDKANHQVRAMGQVFDTPEKVGGWPANNDPEGSGYMFVWTAYHYRSCFDGPPGSWRAATLRKDAGHEPIMADAFSDPDRGVDYHHGDGYNVLMIGGSVKFHQDTGRAIANLNGSQTYQTMYFGYQTRVWEEFFAQP